MKRIFKYVQSRAKRFGLRQSSAAFFIAIIFLTTSLSLPAAPTTPLTQPDISFRHEVQHAIDHGLTWLKDHQNTNGSWSTADHPAVTALALSAFMGNPTSQQPADTIKRGYQHILSDAKPDGSIYQTDLQNYNTAICLMALLAAHNPAYDTPARQARHWLLNQQLESGGVGYGDHGKISDMNNTFTALEALYYSKHLDQDKPDTNTKDLNWPAALQFIQSCQNTNGGFIYAPGNSKAGTETNAEGRIAFRSYGSITYAGMMSYIYADLKHDDPRVTAAFNWLRNNFTLTENPAMAQQGYYYYLHLMAKALNTCGIVQFELKNGTKINWRQDLALKLINLQKSDGSWVNDTGRWWEKDPALVTAYSVMSLEIVYRGL